MMNPFVWSASGLRSTGIGVAITVLIWASSLSAQEPTPGMTGQPKSERPFALTVGIGDGSLGLATQMSVVLHRAEHDIMARAVRTRHFDPITGGSGKTIGDIALLYGRRVRMDGGWARVAAGLGLARGQRSESGVYPKDRIETLGLAWQGDVAIVPAKSFAFGVAAFGNLNDEMRFVGLTGSLHFFGVQ